MVLGITHVVLHDTLGLCSLYVRAPYNRGLEIKATGKVMLLSYKILSK